MHAFKTFMKETSKENIGVEENTFYIARFMIEKQTYQFMTKWQFFVSFVDDIFKV
jgi:hypothetical protein